MFVTKKCPFAAKRTESNHMLRACFHMECLTTPMVLHASVYVLYNRSSQTVTTSSGINVGYICWVYYTIAMYSCLTCCTGKVQDSVTTPTNTLPKHLPFHPSIMFLRAQQLIWFDICLHRSSFQWQGQIIVYHTICGKWLLVPVLDTCFSNISPHRFWYLLA